MYDFSQKQELKSRAKVAHIDIYRAMLSERAHPAANWISIDQEQLAKDFLYILLDLYTIEEIEARTQPVSPALKVTFTGTAEPALTGIKKITKHLEKVTQEVKKKLKKGEEYPKIDWNDLENPIIRTADSIFSDRIATWRRLSELEKLTQDGTAPTSILQEIIDLEIRRELCFQELRHLNDKGEFLGKHPFIAQKTERDHALELIRNDPEAFFRERKAIEGNISRYSSQIKGKKASKEVKERAKINLEKYQTRLKLYKEVYNNYMDGKRDENL